MAITPLYLCNNPDELLESLRAMAQDRSYESSWPAVNYWITFEKLIREVNLMGPHEDFHSNMMDFLRGRNSILVPENTFAYEWLARKMIS